MRRRERFALFPSRLLGFTPGRGRKVQFKLDILPPVVLETHGLLTAPLVRAFSHRSRLGLSIAPPFGIRSASLACRRHGLSGRRRRARSPSRWPPSAAQTARAVFPHAAFTKTPSQALRSKVSTLRGSPAPTHHKALTFAAASSRDSASACIDATKSAARSNGRVG